MTSYKVLKIMAVLLTLLLQVNTKSKNQSGLRKYSVYQIYLISHFIELYSILLTEG